MQKKHLVSFCPIKGLLTMHSLCQRCPTSESPGMQREFSMVVCPSCSHPPNNGALLLLKAQASSQVPSAMAFHTQAQRALHPTHSTLLLILSCCPHTATPSPLPGADLWSLSLSTQFLPSSQAVVSRVVVQMVHETLTLLGPLQSHYCSFSQ